MIDVLLLTVLVVIGVALTIHNHRRDRRLEPLRDEEVEVLLGYSRVGYRHTPRRPR